MIIVQLQCISVDLIENDYVLHCSVQTNSDLINTTRVAFHALLLPSTCY